VPSGRNRLARAKSDTDYLPGVLLVQVPLEECKKEPTIFLHLLDNRSLAQA